MAISDELTGHVALVTGGAGGIGSAVCRELAARGATVACVDLDGDAARSVADSIGASGGTATGMTLDVTSRPRVEEVTAQLARELGPIDILVNNVGSSEVGPFIDTKEDSWDITWEVNLKSAFRLSQVLLPGMIARGGGRIVNVASDAGRVGASGSVDYSAAKGGLIAFSKALAREVATHGITVNAVCPGPTETPLLERSLEATPKLRDAMVRAVPLKRLGQPEDVAAAVAFLATPAACFITGQTLSVSGGLTMV